MVKRTRINKILTFIEQGKHVLVAKKYLKHIKRCCELVKELKMRYGHDRKELFLKTTVPEHGKYIVYIVARSEIVRDVEKYIPAWRPEEKPRVVKEREKVTRVLHRFYVKSSTKSISKGRKYNVISMRIPSELRGSTLYIKIYKLL